MCDIVEDDLLKQIIFSNDHVMILKIHIDSEDELLKNMYKESVDKHNQSLLNNAYPDAGFDLITPTEYNSVKGYVNKINFRVKCSAQIIYNYGNKSYNTGFYLYPRSSLSKTQLRLANSVGIIDSGYRGHLIGAFDCMTYYYNDTSCDYLVMKYDKLVQICAPGLIPIYVILVDEIENDTIRGEDGFGSTGK